MDLRKIKKLIEIVEQSGIVELEVHKGDESVRIVRPGGNAPGAVASASPSAVVVSQAAGDAPAEPAATAATVRAPMAGTFYSAPEPGAERYVKVGSRVGMGDILCIIESMKMMNEIPSQTEGSVLEILVADGEPVAKGQGLFRVA